MTTVRQVYVLLFRKYCEFKELNLFKKLVFVWVVPSKNYFTSKVVIKVNYICQAKEIDCSTLHYFGHVSKSRKIK